MTKTIYTAWFSFSIFWSVVAVAIEHHGVVISDSIIYVQSDLKFLLRKKCSGEPSFQSCHLDGTSSRVDFVKYYALAEFDEEAEKAKKSDQEFSNLLRVLASIESNLKISIEPRLSFLNTKLKETYQDKSILEQKISEIKKISPPPESILGKALIEYEKRLSGINDLLISLNKSVEELKVTLQSESAKWYEAKAKVEARSVVVTFKYNEAKNNFGNFFSEVLGSPTLLPFEALTPSYQLIAKVVSNNYERGFPKITLRKNIIFYGPGFKCLQVDIGHVTGISAIGTAYSLSYHHGVINVSGPSNRKLSGYNDSGPIFDMSVVNETGGARLQFRYTKNGINCPMLSELLPLDR